MKCLNCHLEMIPNVNVCPYCGWTLGEPPKDKHSLVQALESFIQVYDTYQLESKKNIDKYQEQMGFANQNYSESAIAQKRATLEKLQREHEVTLDDKLNRLPTGLVFCIGLAIAFSYYVYTVVEHAEFSGFICLVICVIAFFVQNVFNAKINKDAPLKNPEKAEQEEHEIEKLSEKLQDIQRHGERKGQIEKNALINYQNRKQQLDTWYHQFQEFNFLAPEVRNSDVCKKMLSFLNDNRANTYADAINLYYREKELKEQREMIRDQINQARKDGLAQGRREGYQKGYNAGYGGGYSEGHYNGKHGRI